MIVLPLVDRPILTGGHLLWIDGPSRHERVIARVARESTGEQEIFTSLPQAREGEVPAEIDMNVERSVFRGRNERWKGRLFPIKIELGELAADGPKVPHIKRAGFESDRDQLCAVRRETLRG